MFNLKKFVEREGKVLKVFVMWFNEWYN